MTGRDDKEGLRWAAAIALIAAALLFFLRMAVIWWDVDASSGLFRGAGSGLCTAYNLIATVLLVGTLAGALVLQARRRKAAEKSAAPEKRKEDAFDRYDAVFVEEQKAEEKTADKEEEQSDLAAAATWEGTLSAFSYLLPGFGFLFFALSFLLQGELDTLTFLFSVLSALCGAFFLFAGIRNRTDKAAFTAFFGLIPAAWATLRMVIEYRDVEKYVNREMYTANLIFLIAVVCFFVYQAQVTLGNETYAMPVSWVASALLVLLFGLSARLPQLFGLLADHLGDMDLVDAAGLVLDLSLVLFAGMKIKRITA